MKTITLLLSLLLFSHIAFAANKSKANHLLNESSPYLQQHAYNPVNWYPWGEEAFSRARKENKPLFISIGYSTCHWCHVMAHESFENQKIADILNKHFISVKVDREERPDIDRIYLTAAEILAGYGGWPTTIITNTQLQPFFANTYIPPFAKNGRKGLEDILNSVTTLWRDDKTRINQVASEVTALIKAQLINKTTEGKVKESGIEKTYQAFVSSYDAEHGGFGNAPKFPRSAIFEFLLAYAKTQPDSKASNMVNKTFEHMLRGGIYDQVGGGFHRYSVDARWKVPHFEKMLYDQGLIINSLLDANHEKKFQNTIDHSLQFVLNNMRSPQGGFYSAIDADSTRPDNQAEHGEGAYYIWKKSELDNLLNSDEQKLFYVYYNIKEKGNVSSDPQKEFTGLNILHADESLNTIAKDLSLSFTSASKILNRSLKKLAKARKKRPLPHLDDKVITSWNALMLKATAKAYGQIKNKKYLDASIKNARFIHRYLYNPTNKQLYRSYRNGHRSGEAYLDDYAYMTSALISLYKNTGDRQWLIWADNLMQQQIALFYDTTHHGFFDNTANDKNILFRSKEIYDGSLPSANAISVENLIELSTLLKKPTWASIASQSLHSFHQRMNELHENYPQMYKSLILLGNK